MSLLHLIWQLPLFIILCIVFFITFIGEKAPHLVSWSDMIIFKLIQFVILIGIIIMAAGIFTSIAGVS